MSVTTSVSINVITFTNRTGQYGINMITFTNIPDEYDIRNVNAEVTLVNSSNMENNTVSIKNSSIVTTMPNLIFTDDGRGTYNVIIICNLHSDSDANLCKVMAVANGRMTRTGMYVM